MTKTRRKTPEETPPVRKSPTYLLVSEKVGKDAIVYLRERRAKEVSWRGISLQLLSEHGVDVTEVTLRKWWADAEAGA